MQLTLAGRTALRILRVLRSSQRSLPACNAGLHEPDASPHERWSRRAIDLSRYGIGANEPVEVLVGSREKRLRVKGVRCGVCMGTLPDGAFFDLGGGFYSAGPELVFLQMAAHSALPDLVLLGLELCGCFSRDALNPIDGSAEAKLRPATSVARIGAFLSRVKSVNGLGRARQALRYMADNAWSPMEAVVAAMMMLPLVEYGYEFGHCTLNLRVDTREFAIGPGDKSERVPDILVDDTPVGINYDGVLHLDLGAVKDAAFELGQHPGSARAERFTDAVVAQVRAKAVDDIRRNRALAAAGMTVYPVVKEDLYELGALDGVMWQVLVAIEAQTKKRYPLLRQALRSETARDERFRMLARMLPGRVRVPEEGDVVEAFVRLPSHRRG